MLVNTKPLRLNGFYKLNMFAFYSAMAYLTVSFSLTETFPYMSANLRPQGHKSTRPHEC